jgi:hypothetical protein
MTACAKVPIPHPRGPPAAGPAGGGGCTGGGPPPGLPAARLPPASGSPAGRPRRQGAAPQPSPSRPRTHSRHGRADSCWPRRPLQEGEGVQKARLHNGAYRRAFEAWTLRPKALSAGPARALPSSTQRLDRLAAACLLRNERWFSALHAIRWPFGPTRKFSSDSAWPRRQFDLAVLRSKAMFSAWVAIMRWSGFQQAWTPQR